MLKFIPPYCSEAFADDLSPLAERIKQTLDGVDYDTLVGTGLSGTLVVPFVARALGKHWLIVRKPGDSAHSGNPAEGVLGAKWVFLDDFIATGSTFHRVWTTITTLARISRYASKCVGIVEYATFRFSRPGRLLTTRKVPESV